MKAICIILVAGLVVEGNCAPNSTRTKVDTPERIPHDETHDFEPSTLFNETKEAGEVPTNTTLKAKVLREEQDSLKATNISTTPTTTNSEGPDSPSPGGGSGSHTTNSTTNTTTLAVKAKVRRGELDLSPTTGTNGIPKSNCTERHNASEAILHFLKREAEDEENSADNSEFEGDSREEEETTMSTPGNSTNVNNATSSTTTADNVINRTVSTSSPHPSSSISTTTRISTSTSSTTSRRPTKVRREEFSHFEPETSSDEVDNRTGQHSTGSTPTFESTSELPSTVLPEDIFSRQSRAVPHEESSTGLPTTVRISGNNNHSTSPHFTTAKPPSNSNHHSSSTSYFPSPSFTLASIMVATAFLQE